MIDQSLISLGTPLVGGGAIGLATGHVLKKLMKLAFIVIGGVAIFLGCLQ